MPQTFYRQWLFRLKSAGWHGLSRLAKCSQALASAADDFLVILVVVYVVKVRKLVHLLLEVQEEEDLQPSQWPVTPSVRGHGWVAWERGMWKGHKLHIQSMSV